MKVPVIVAATAAGRANADDVEAAITRSDNDAALRLWDGLDDGPAEVEADMRRAGDAETWLEREPDERGWSSFGRTVWSLAAAATVHRALAARAEDFEAAKRLASQHVPQHPNAPQLRASGER